MGSLIDRDSSQPAVRSVTPIAPPRQALPPGETFRVVQTGPLPDRCGQCGTVLGGASPPEGKQCPNCGRLNTPASLSADY
ncbi:hypothetical protein EPO33_01430 [Patescibacteria group bacterium]|nr:MAG: hypothetical protein EPO33_01430 [Patescibacteria group bacterium]